MQHVARRSVMIPTLKLGRITIWARVADYCVTGAVLIISLCIQGNSPVRTPAVSVDSPTSLRVRNRTN